MIRKILTGTAIAIGAATVIAAPVSADPSPFGTLGCSCQPPVAVPDRKAPAADQIDQGIQNGLDYLHGASPGTADN